jgi:hypothetical protein
MSSRRRILQALACMAVTAAVAGGGLAVSAGAAHAGTAPTILLNRGSNLCLGSGGPGPNVRQDTCYRSLDQLWTAVPLSSGRYQVIDGYGMCLGVQGASTADGAWVEKETCNGSSAQEWIPGGATAQDPYFSYQLVNVNSNKCLGIYKAMRGAGYPAVQWSCQNSPNQFWNGTWFFGTVTDANSHQCMGVLGASTAQGAAVVQWPCNTSADQVWELDPATNRLQNSNDGMCLGVNGASIFAGAQILQWACNGSPDQSWNYNASTGQFTNANSGMCLGVPGASMAQGTQLVQWPCNGSPDQQWTRTMSTRGQ